MNTTRHALFILAGYHDDDLTTDELERKDFKRVHGEIEASYSDSLHFEFESSRLDGRPHIVTHDGLSSLACSCEGAVLYGARCWAMKRTDMILRKRQARERRAIYKVLPEDEVKGHLSSASGKPFSLLR